MSIAQGFFGTLAQDIDDKQTYIRDKVEQRSAELRKMGLERMAQVRDQRQAYETAAQRLMRMEGVDQNRVLMALESDPDSVLDVYRRVESNPDINGEVINNFYSVYDSQPTVGSISEALDTILPISQQVVSRTKDPAEREAMTFAAMLGLDVEAALDKQVYNSQIVGNMTGNDILALGDSPVRARGNSQGVQFDYEIFSDASLYPDEDEDFSLSEIRLVNGEISSGYMAAIEREVDSIQKQILDLQAEENEDNLSKIEELLQRQQELMGLVDTYPEGGASFNDAAEELLGPDIRNRVFETLRIDPNKFYGVTPEEQERQLELFEESDIAEDASPPEVTTTPLDEEAPVPEEAPIDITDIITEEDNSSDNPDVTRQRGASVNRLQEQRGESSEEVELNITEEEAISENFREETLKAFFEANPDKNSVTISVLDEDGNVKATRTFTRSEARAYRSIVQPEPGWLAEELGPGVITDMLNKE